MSSENSLNEKIEKRLTMLNMESTGDSVIDLSDNVISTFISDEQKVIFDHGGYGYLLNDKSIYEDLINNRHKNPNVSPLKNVFYTLYEYFGEPSPTAEADLDEYYQSKDEYLQKSLKEVGLFEKGTVILNVEDFKNRNMAVCGQFAPMAHNLLRYIGVESYILYGRKKYGEERWGAHHVFNCIKSADGKFFLIDFLVKSKNPDGTLEAFLIQDMDKEMFDSFINGDNTITCNMSKPVITYQTDYRKMSNNIQI